MLHFFQRLFFLPSEVEETVRENCRLRQQNARLLSKIEQQNKTIDHMAKVHGKTLKDLEAAKKNDMPKDPETGLFYNPNKKRKK